MQLKNTDKLEVINGYLVVNGNLFIVDFPNQPISHIEDNKLVTLFRGCRSMANYWNPEDIKGYYKPWP